MHTYAATYITGWEEIVETALRHDIPDFELLFSEDGLIVFQTEQSYEQLQMISYLNNIFFVYHFDNASGQNKSVHAVVKSLAQKGSFKPLQGKTYRLMVMHGSKLEHVTREVSNMLKFKITNQTGLEFSPLKADIEFWVLIRNSGAVVFGYKTENESQKIPVQQGELRPKIAELLVMASKPMPEDTFLDPFAGYGSIPAARIRLEPYSKLICVEQKGKLVEELKRRFRTEQNVEVRQGDALHMTFIQNASVDVIVSDPPWGMYEEAPLDMPVFYTTFLMECSRILKPETGRAVLLTGQPEAMTVALGEVPSLHSTREYTTLVNGKKASVFIVQLARQ